MRRAVGIRDTPDGVRTNRATSPFQALKVELVHPKRATREQARLDLFAYIEGYYNRRRIHSALGHRPPEQAELQMA